MQLYTKGYLGPSGNPRVYYPFSPADAGLPPLRRLLAEGPALPSSNFDSPPLGSQRCLRAPAITSPAEPPGPPMPSPECSPSAGAASHGMGKRLQTESRRMGAWMPGAKSLTACTSASLRGMATRLHLRLRMPDDSPRRALLAQMGRIAQPKNPLCS